MINLSIKKLFRRCLLIAVIGVATGCANTKQMPSSPVVVQERSFNTTTSVPELLKAEVVPEEPSHPLALEVLPKDLVLETPAPYGNLIDYISTKYKVSEKTAKDIINIVDKYANESFPKRNDILAVIAVESSYNTWAKHRGCFGLMQIEKKSHTKTLKGRSLHDAEVNIEIGAGTLSTYYDILNSNKRGAILAFNSGIGNFQKGRFNSEYYQKYLKELKILSKL